MCVIRLLLSRFAQHKLFSKAEKMLAQWHKWLPKDFGWFEMVFLAAVAAFIIPLLRDFYRKIVSGENFTNASVRVPSLYGMLVIHSLLRLQIMWERSHAAFIHLHMVVD